MDDLLKTLTHDYYGSPTGSTTAALNASRLFIVSGPLAGRSFELGARPLTIGRRAGCTIHLPASNVSKLHCTIACPTSRSYALRDEGSTNGTLVNDRRVTPGAWHELAQGDKIRIGETILFLVDPRPALEGAAEVETIQIDRAAAISEAEKAIRGCGTDLRDITHRSPPR